MIIKKIILYFMQSAVVLLVERETDDQRVASLSIIARGSLKETLFAV